MSAAEYRFMQDNLANYQLYRVSDVDGEAVVKRLLLEQGKFFLEVEGYWVEIVGTNKISKFD